MGVTTEYLEHAPAGALGDLLTLTGYRIDGARPGVHAGLPSTTLTLIVAIDEPLRVADGPGEPETAFDVMVAGLHERAAEVRHDGFQAGVQIDLTPEACRALLAVPAAELGGHVLEFDTVLNDVGERLADAVNDAATWAARFRAAERVLSELLVAGPAPQNGPANDAWRMITESPVGMPIATVAREIGWSRRHLAERFRAEYGLGPKTVASIVRFDRAQAMVRAQPRRSLADVAARCGFSDHAHLSREWRRFTRRSPTEWLAEDDLLFVQDAQVDLGAR